MMQWQDQLQGNVWHAEAHVSSTRTWEEVSGTGGLQGQGSGQRGVNLSVAVSFVLFRFLFSVYSWGGLVGVVALCIDVGLVGEGS